MSLSAAALRKMLELGLTADQMVELAEVLEQDRANAGPAVDEQAERRRKADRERKRLAREQSGNMSADTSAEMSADTSAETPLLDKEKSPTPPKEINPTPPPVRPLTRTNVPTPSPKAFDEFWLAYPRKVGKGAARKAFAKALGKIRTPEPLATIMAALNTANRAWADVDAQFIPHAATWLNQDRWEDEPLAVATGPPRADDEREQAERIARIDRMTDDERKAHFAAELERWQTENPSFRAM